MYFSILKINNRTMKQVRLLTFVLIVLTTFNACNKPEPIVPESPTPSGEDTTIVEEFKDNIYQFKVLAGNGDSVSLAQYRGMVILVVNTATQCGYTPQYTQLEQWYQDYKDRGFVILDFPCNQFGNQAPGDYDDIHDYCTDHYNITFPQFAKINVNGASESPLYTWLKSKKPGKIKWNFTKFLVNRDGEVAERFEPNDMGDVEAAIEAQLGD